MTFDRKPISIVRRLLSAGYEAYIVGGAVRDSLLGKAPKDYDITTSATPEQVRHVFGRRKCRIIGRRFRLALVFEGGEIFEVSTFRREPTMKERHSRQDDEGAMIWSDNEYGTFEDDVSRRDFTVNALYYDVNRKRIVDRVGGIKDLRSRMVKCIGDPDTRFAEDPVRMLRALKLVGQNSFVLADNIQQAILRHGALIRSASPARLTEEFMKIMNCDSALGIFEACEKYGFLQHFIPELSRIWDTEGGELIRSMLRQHDECLDEDNDFMKQRSFAFAIVSLPYLLGNMDMEDIVVHRHWVTARQNCQASLRKFFDCFDIIRDVEGDLCDFAVMMPSMMFAKTLPKAVRTSPLYPYAYELFRMLTMATGNLIDNFKRLPFPEESKNKAEQLWDVAEGNDFPEHVRERPPKPRERKRVRPKQAVMNEGPAELAEGSVPCKPVRWRRRKKKSEEQQ